MKRLSISSSCVAAVLSLAVALSAGAQPQSGQVPAGSEGGQDAAALVARDRIKLNLAGAELLVAAAKKKAAEMGVKVNVAVADDGGHLIAFARMDGAPPASGYTAQTKAASAATFRPESGPLPNVDAPDVALSLSVQNAALAGGWKTTTLKGGVAVIVDGQRIGAVGVGGATGEQDAEVAKAAIQFFLDELARQDR